MTSDLPAMLRRVVGDVFGETVEARWRRSIAQQGVVQVELNRTDGTHGRTVVLSASETGVFQLHFLDLDCHTALIEYDDEAYMEAILRQLARVADAYLSGAGRVEFRRGLFKKRQVLRINVDGNEWIVGRHGGTVFYPEDD